MASVFVLLEAFNRKEAAALGFFPCATASFASLRPQARVEAQAPEAALSAETEAAARRRLMRAESAIAPR